MSRKISNQLTASQKISNQLIVRRKISNHECVDVAQSHAGPIRVRLRTRQSDGQSSGWHACHGLAAAQTETAAPVVP
jgi:hypothetical protein